MTTHKPISDLKVSEAFSELEKIVAAFENEELDLEESMPKFKRGLELAKMVKGKLTVMENEIKEIQAEFQADDHLSGVTESAKTTADEKNDDDEDDGDDSEMPF